jgi:excisionase family DNA binding protein
MATQVTATQPSSIPFPTGANRRIRHKGKTKASHAKATGGLCTTAVKVREREQEDEWLKYRGAANLIGTSAGTLMVWVCTGRYSVPHYKIGRSVRFRRSELLVWLETRKRGGVQ